MPRTSKQAAIVFAIGCAAGLLINVFLKNFAIDAFDSGRQDWVGVLSVFFILPFVFVDESNHWYGVPSPYGFYLRQIVPVILASLFYGCVFAFVYWLVKKITGKKEVRV